MELDYWRTAGAVMRSDRLLGGLLQAVNMRATILLLAFCWIAFGHALVSTSKCHVKRELCLSTGVRNLKGIFRAGGHPLGNRQDCMRLCERVGLGGHGKGIAYTAINPAGECYCADQSFFKRASWPKSHWIVPNGKCTSKCSKGPGYCGGKLKCANLKSCKLGRRRLFFSELPMLPHLTFLTLLQFECDAPKAETPWWEVSHDKCGKYQDIDTCDVEGFVDNCRWDVLIKRCTPEYTTPGGSVFSLRLHSEPTVGQCRSLIPAVALDNLPDCLEECAMRNKCHGVSFVPAQGKAHTSTCTLLDCEGHKPWQWAAKVGGAKGELWVRQRWETQSLAKLKYKQFKATQIMGCDALHHDRAESMALCRKQCDEQVKCHAFSWFWKPPHGRKCELKTCVNQHFVHNKLYTTFLKEDGSRASTTSQTSGPQLPVLASCSGWTCTRPGQICTKGHGWVCTEEPDPIHMCFQGTPCWHSHHKTKCSTRKTTECEHDKNCQQYGAGKNIWCMPTPGTCAERTFHNCEKGDSCQWMAVPPKAKRKSTGAWQPHCSDVPTVCAQRSAHLCETVSDGTSRCDWSVDEQICTERDSTFYLRHQGMGVNGWFAHKKGCVDLSFSKKQSLSLCQHDCNIRKSCQGFEYGTGAKNSNICILRSCRNQSFLVKTPVMDYYTKEQSKQHRSAMSREIADMDAKLQRIGKMEKHECILKPWGDWGACTKTCGTGHKVRRREIALEAAGGAKPCPASTSAERQQTALCSSTSCSAMRMYLRRTCKHLDMETCIRHERCTFNYGKKTCVPLPQLCKNRVGERECVLDGRCQWSPWPIENPHCQAVPPKCADRTQAPCETDGRCAWESGAPSTDPGNRRLTLAAAHRHIDDTYVEMCSSRSCKLGGHWSKFWHNGKSIPACHAKAEGACRALCDEISNCIGFLMRPAQKSKWHKTCCLATVLNMRVAQNFRNGWPSFKRKANIGSIPPGYIQTCSSGQCTWQGKLRAPTKTDEGPCFARRTMSECSAACNKLAWCVGYQWRAWLPKNKADCCLLTEQNLPLIENAGITGKPLFFERSKYRQLCFQPGGKCLIKGSDPASCLAHNPLNAVKQSWFQCHALCEGDRQCTGFLFDVHKKRCCIITTPRSGEKVMQHQKGGWPTFYARPLLTDLTGRCKPHDCSTRTQWTCNHDGNCQYRSGKCEVTPWVCAQRIADTCAAGGRCRWDKVASTCAEPVNELEGKFAMLQLVLLLPHDSMQALDRGPHGKCATGRDCFRLAVALSLMHWLKHTKETVAKKDIKIISIEMFHPEVNKTRMQNEGSEIWAQTAVALEIPANDDAAAHAMLHAVQSNNYVQQLQKEFSEVGFVANPTGHRLHKEWISVGEAALMSSDTGFVPGMYGESTVRAVAPDGTATTFGRPGVLTAVAVLGAALAAVVAVGVCMSQTNCVSLCCSSGHKNRASRRYSNLEMEVRRPAPYSDDADFDEIDNQDPVEFSERDLQQLRQLEHYKSELERTSASGADDVGGFDQLNARANDSSSPRTTTAPQTVDGSLTQVPVPDFLG